MNKNTALHEAAHAVVQYRASGNFVGLISVIPDQQAGTLGHVTDYYTDSTCEDDLRCRILSCYAGGHADRRTDGYIAEACSQDDEGAAECLRILGIENEESIMRAESGRLVEIHWKEIEAVADELLERKTLDETELMLIVEIAAGSDETTADHLANYRKLRYG